MDEDMAKALETVMQDTGDGIADMFEQMIRGKWVDEIGNPVVLNSAMIRLKTVLVNLAKFRSDHMGYNEATFPIQTPDL